MTNKCIPDWQSANSLHRPFSELQYLSVQCYAWAEYKFTCVCLCVSVTFCLLAYRSDPSTDFYRWLLKRRVFTQGCAFWGSRWWIITFRGPKSPKTSILGAWIWPKYAKNSNSYIFRSVCITLTWNLTDSSGQQRLRGWSCMVVKQFQDGGRPPFWKSIYRHISVKNHPSSNFDEILYTLHSSKFWTGWTSRDQKWKLHWTDSEFDSTYFLLLLLLPHPIRTTSEIVSVCSRAK